MVLKIEQDEAPLLEQPSLLLTIGRCVVLNFFQDTTKFRGRSADDTISLNTGSVTSSTWKTSPLRQTYRRKYGGNTHSHSDSPYFTPNAKEQQQLQQYHQQLQQQQQQQHTDDSDDSSDVEWFDSNYLLSSSPISQSVYVDAYEDYHSRSGHVSLFVCLYMCCVVCCVCVCFVCVCVCVCVCGVVMCDM